MMAHLCASLDQRGRANLASALRNANFSEGVSPDEEAFLEADENRDGHLSRAEFKKFWKAKQVAEADDAPGVSPTHRQLMLVALASGIPFIGFGFCDNSIMILSGDQIEKTLGVAFGISAMAAAGLGNAISDVAGIGLADHVESLFGRMGIPQAKLKKNQQRLGTTRFAKTFGASVGVTIGCLLGMFPLLFI